MSNSDQHPECTRCGRPLRSAESIARTMGRTCARRDRAERSYSAAQREKASEVVELHAIADTAIRTARRHRVFLVIGSNGIDRYHTTVTACTCPAGLRGRRCYHRLAAVLAA